MNRFGSSVAATTRALLSAADDITKRGRRVHIDTVLDLCASGIALDGIAHAEDIYLPASVTDNS